MSIGLDVAHRPCGMNADLGWKPDGENSYVGTAGVTSESDVFSGAGEATASAYDLP